MNLDALVKDAKQNPRAAEKTARALLHQLFPALDITACQINAGSKVSLNSVNGFLTTADARTLFFKFHAEEGEEQSLKNSEYYRAEILQKAGWPIITPLATSTVPGQQCVVYEKLAAPTAYDVFGAADAHYLATGRYDEAQLKALLRAEENYLKKTTAIMLESLAPAQGADNEKAALHQLFSHRLHETNGAAPRVDLFYKNQQVVLPDGTSRPFEDIAAKEWVINGVPQPHTLAEIIALSKKILAASATNSQATVISHGDDHNGNKFFIDGEFIAFDPAFAGRHPALLAPIKATLHNACLHPFWYYEPERITPRLSVSFSLAGTQLHVTHNGDAVLASPLRQDMLALHRQHVWQPLLAALRAQGLLPDQAADFLAAAAFCCPFLALNMIDNGRGALPLFNLAQCVALFKAPANV